MARRAPLFKPQNYIAYGFMLLHCTRTISDADDPHKGLLIIGLLSAGGVALSMAIKRAQKNIHSSVEDDDDGVDTSEDD